MALPATRLELAGWALLWSRLAIEPGPDPGRLDAAWLTTTEGLGRLAAERALPEHPAVARVRRLFRQAGTDPTRYRPSSEALARRVLRGEALPRISTAVDLNNLLSLRTLLPCCVLRTGSIAAEVALRRGDQGEAMESLRGPFELAGRPLLADLEGPFSTPITDSRRVAVRPEDSDVLLVVYAPEADPEVAGSLAGLCAETGAASLLEQGWVAAPEG